MRKLVKLTVLFGVAALCMLLAVGYSAAAQTESDADDGAAEEPETEAEAVEEAAPEGTAVRINFEIAGQAAKKGHYSVQTLGGGEIASWYALEGWEDSGWISNLDIGNKTVLVEVLYYPGPGAVPTHLLILNHVPDDEYGWVSEGVAHALEVAWPETELVCWMPYGEQHTAYFTRTVDGIVHRTMVDDGEYDVFKPASKFDQPGDGWELWYYYPEQACTGANRTEANYNDYLGADSPYWHSGS
jgi:hypothetical protein